MKTKKIKDAYNFGRFKLVFALIYDKLFKKETVNNVIYDIFLHSAEKDYKHYLEKYYEFVTGKRLDINNPTTYNEKIQWLKLHDSTVIKTKLVDKYEVRDWVRCKIGNGHLIPLLGVWDSYDDIDFNMLPNQFVLKCTHGSHMVRVVKNKNMINHKEFKETFDKWLITNFAFCSGLELQYKNVKPRIIAEKYIEQMDGDLFDYKFHVFSGKVKLVQIIGKRDFKNYSGKEVIVDENWNKTDLMYKTYDDFSKKPLKPANYDEMKRIAEKLADGFAYVRVDLYSISNTVYFGEMTFTPGSGIGNWDEESNKLVGSWIELPVDKIEGELDA